MNWDIWGPPLAVFGVSALVGLVMVVRIKGEANQNVQNKDLLARKQQLIEQIQELEADQNKFSPEVYQQERERLVSLAAQVLEQLEKPESDSTVSRRSSELSTSFLTTFAFLLLVFGGILYGVTQFAKPRAEGQIMTGGETSMLEELMAKRQAEVDEATRMIEADPNNLDALNVLGYDALMRQDLQGAMGYIETARGLQPDHPDVLLHLAILQMQVGMGERAEISISQALTIRPDFPRGLLWRCLLRMRAGDKEAALLDLNSAEGKLTWPEDIGFFNAIQAELVRPPPLLTGEITVSSELIVPDGVLFVIARRSKTGGGPPVAVSRIASPHFPMPFTLGKGDMVMGGEWPEEVWLEARLDQDGNAMTKMEDDWTSLSLGPLSGENHGLEIILQGVDTDIKSSEEDQTAQGIRVRGEVQFSGDGLGVLFVIARRADVDKGPPLAVKRVSNPVFPYSFSMQDSDIMLGGDWPEEVWIEARLDQDGNAMTRMAGDWTSTRQGPLPIGTDDVLIRLGSQLRE